MSMQLRSNRVFLQSMARDFRRTGAIAPSSKMLAQAMTSELASCNKPQVSVLEVGAGTGSVTAEIVRHLGAGDQLDVCEIDRKLASIIRHRLRNDSAFTAADASIRVINKPIESFERRPAYDFIISCLPFTNFQPAAVRGVFELYRGMLRPGGICSFYEYILVRKATRLVTGKTAVGERVAGVSEVVREYVGKYCYRHQVVLLNLPPAMVHHIRFPEA
ncbi:MAG: methyltransferase domain-containing protein [Acidobacteria bacterium]|nr:methyltransferase domain-containing protein [Acidobacteriota bacterium]